MKLILGAMVVVLILPFIVLGFICTLIAGGFCGGVGLAVELSERLKP